MKQGDWIYRGLEYVDRCDGFPGPYGEFISFRGQPLLAKTTEQRTFPSASDRKNSFKFMTCFSYVTQSQLHLFSSFSFFFFLLFSFKEVLSRRKTFLEMDQAIVSLKNNLMRQKRQTLNIHTTHLKIGTFSDFCFKASSSRVICPIVRNVQDCSHLDVY